MGKCWAVIIVFGAFLNMLPSNGFLQCFGILVVEWQEEFDGTSEEIGWIGSFLLIGHAVAGLAIALFGSSLSCRSITMFGGALACVALSFSLLATYIWHMFLVMVVTGFGLCCAMTGSVSVVGFHVDEYLGIANGFVTSGASFGLLIIAPLLAYLIEKYSWRGAMLIFAGIVANVCVTGALFRKTESEKYSHRDFSKRTGTVAKGNPREDLAKASAEDDSSSSERSFNSEEHANHAMVAGAAIGGMDESENEKTNVLFKDRVGSCVQMIRGSRHSDTISLFTNTRLLLFNTSLFLRGFAYFASMAHFVALCVANNISKNDATFLLSLMGICGASSRLTHGIFIDKSLITPLHMLSLSLIIGGTACILIGIITSFTTVVLFAVVFGATGGIFHGIIPVTIRHILLDDHQVNMFKGGLGIAVAVSCTGGLVGVPTIGYLYDVTENYTASCYVAGGLLVASGILHSVDPFLVRWQRRHRTPNIRDKDTSSTIIDMTD